MSVVGAEPTHRAQTALFDAPDRRYTAAAAETATTARSTAATAEATVSDAAASHEQPSTAGAGIGAEADQPGPFDRGELEAADEEGTADIGGGSSTRLAGSTCGLTRPAGAVLSSS